MEHGIELNVLKARLKEESAYLTSRLSVSDLAFNAAAAAAAAELEHAELAPLSRSTEAPSAPKTRKRGLTASSSTARKPDTATRADARRPAAAAPDINMSLPPPLPPQQAHLLASPYHSPHNYTHAFPPRTPRADPSTVPRRMPASSSPPHGSGIPVLKTRSTSPPKREHEREHERDRERDRPDSELTELGPRPPSITLVKNEPPPFVMFPGADGDKEGSTGKSPAAQPHMTRRVSPTSPHVKPRSSAGRGGPSNPSTPTGSGSAGASARPPSSARLAHEHGAGPNGAGGAQPTPPHARLGVAAHWIPPENNYTPPKGAAWDDVVLPTVAKKLGIGAASPGSGGVPGEEGDLAVEWDRDGTPIKWVKRDPRAQPGLSNDDFVANQQDGSRRAFSPSFEPSPDNPLHPARQSQPSPSPRPTAQGGGEPEPSPLRGPRPTTYAQHTEIYDAYASLAAPGSAPAPATRPAALRQQSRGKPGRPEPPSPRPFESFAHGGPAATTGQAQFGAAAFPPAPEVRRDQWDEKRRAKGGKDEVGKGCGCTIM
ncbi:hypothetical protein Q5752_005452 [Cryptotrichosporon argae]